MRARALSIAMLVFLCFSGPLSWEYSSQLASQTDQRQRLERCQSNMDCIAVDLNRYYVSQGHYPNDLQSLASPLALHCPPFCAVNSCAAYSYDKFESSRGFAYDGYRLACHAHPVALVQESPSYSLGGDVTCVRVEFSGNEDTRIPRDIGISGVRIGARLNEVSFGLGRTYDLVGECSKLDILCDGILYSRDNLLKIGSWRGYVTELEGRSLYDGNRLLLRAGDPGSKVSRELGTPTWCYYKNDICVLYVYDTLSFEVYVCTRSNGTVDRMILLGQTGNRRDVITSRGAQLLPP